MQVPPAPPHGVFVTVVQPSTFVAHATTVVPEQRLPDRVSVGVAGQSVADAGLTHAQVAKPGAPAHGFVAEHVIETVAVTHPFPSVTQE